MTKAKVTELETVIPTSASIDTAAPAEKDMTDLETYIDSLKSKISVLEAQIEKIPASATVVPFNLKEFYPIASEMAQTDFVIENYNKAFARYTETAVIKGELNPTIKMLLDVGFNRVFSVHTASVPSMTDNAAKTAHIRLVEKYWSLSVMNKTAYDALFKVPTTASKGKTPKATVDYTPLITELQALHDSPDYTIEQAEDIAVIIDSLTITTTNTAAEAKAFYKVLTTDTDLDYLHIYVKTALTAATEKAKAKAAAETMATQTAEQAAKAKIMARLKR